MAPEDIKIAKAINIPFIEILKYCIEARLMTHHPEPCVRRFRQLAFFLTLLPVYQCTTPAGHLAVRPVSRVAEPLWVTFHERIEAEAKLLPRPDVLLLGDSLFQGLRKQDEVWQKALPGVSVLNAGIWSDGTQHLLWRLQSGALNGVAPRVVVLLIGTNNGLSSPEEIFDGVRANLEEAEDRFPDAKIVVLGLLPSMKDPQNKRRVRNRAVNVLLRKLADGDSVQVLDLDARFVDANDALAAGAFQDDALHLKRLGYEFLLEGLAPTLKALLAAAP